MTATTGTKGNAPAKRNPSEGAIIAALRRLPPDYLSEVLRYIEFLDYKSNVARADAAEQAALWAAVEANQEYKRQHSDEGLEVHETGADFLKDVADL